MLNKLTMFLCLCLLFLVQANVVAQTCQPSVKATTPSYQFILNNNGTVTNKRAKLMWKRCSEGQAFSAETRSCIGKPALYNWTQGLQRAVNVNRGRSGHNIGYDDWRVPTIDELKSIVEKKCYNPAVNKKLFPSASSAAYWSSSSYNKYTGYAWYVKFSYGRDFNSYKEAPSHVRLVRTNQAK